MQPTRWTIGAVWALTLCLVGWCTSVSAQEPSSPPIKIHVDSIVATYTATSANPRSAAMRNSVVKMDPRLTAKGLAPRLRMMFDYTNYRLLKSQRESASCGGAVAFNLPGGHILQVAPLEQEDGAVAMVLALFEGARMIMRLPFRMTSGGALMLVDQHYPNRFLITAVSVDDSAFREAHHSGSVPVVPSFAAPTIPAWIPSQ